MSDNNYTNPFAVYDDNASVIICEYNLFGTSSWTPTGTEIDLDIGSGCRAEICLTLQA